MNYIVKIIIEFLLSNELVKEGSLEYMEKRGVDLSQNIINGIPQELFRTLLWQTKLLKNNKLFWATFHG